MIIVVKIGGAALEDPVILRKCARAVAELAQDGHRVAVVHGGGSALTRVLKQLGKQSEFVSGLRVTDAETRDVALMVLGGMRTRKAILPDAEDIHELIAGYSGDGTLLPRTLPEICENVRDFVVLENDGRIIGCGALHLYGTHLAEIRSITVAPWAQGKGGGGRLVKALMRVRRLSFFRTAWAIKAAATAAPSGQRSAFLPAQSSAASATAAIPANSTIAERRVCDSSSVCARIAEVPNKLSRGVLSQNRARAAVNNRISGKM